MKKLAVARAARPFSCLRLDRLRWHGSTAPVRPWQLAGNSQGPCRAPDGGAFLGTDLRPLPDRNARWGSRSGTADLNLVVINADLVPNEPEAVSTCWLRRDWRPAENWTFDDDFVERLRYEIDPQWRGEIPRTLLIARDGSTTVIEALPTWKTFARGSTGIVKGSEELSAASARGHASQPFSHAHSNAPPSLGRDDRRRGMPAFDVPRRPVLSPELIPKLALAATSRRSRASCASPTLCW